MQNGSHALSGPVRQGASAERQVEELVSESYSEMMGRVALRCAYGWLNRFSTAPYKGAPKSADASNLKKAAANGNCHSMRAIVCLQLFHDVLDMKVDCGFRYSQVIRD